MKTQQIDVFSSISTLNSSTCFFIAAASVISCLGRQVFCRKAGIFQALLHRAVNLAGSESSICFSCLPGLYAPWP
jgi:hypothetical protein